MFLLGYISASSNSSWIQFRRWQKNYHQFILTEEEKEVLAIAIPDMQSNLKYCEVSLFW